MNMILPGTGVQNTYAPLMAGGKVGGNSGGASPVDGKSFGSFFEDAVQEINNLDAIKNNDAYNLALGEVDDLGSIMVNAERAQTAFQLFVQVRNKLMDSYSEIMRMNV